MGQWGKLGGDLCALWAESVQVIWLRARVLAAGGPEACAEAGLMVTEKLAAQCELAAALASGRFGGTPLSLSTGMTRYLLKGVRANRVRLARTARRG